jgi:hypothetical protein
VTLPARADGERPEISSGDLSISAAPVCLMGDHPRRRKP